MRMRAFALRTMKEIARDKLTIFFGLGFPLIVLALLSIIQSNIPVSLFKIEKLAPGVAVFGLSFIALFSGLLIARDRCTAFLMRLLASPMTAFDYIAGYLLPLLPIALLQGAVCLLAAWVWGLRPSLNTLACLGALLPAGALYAGIGMMCGSVFNDRQVGSLCGALLTNLSAWLSGIWFDVSLLGGAFNAVARVLPFMNAVEAARAAQAGDWAALPQPLLILCAWALAALGGAVALFKRSTGRN
ncbi:MAG: ABC transporter permease [Clostridia bacterium]|nr:ABC transporter permease [Clostridia bacterium]